MDIQQIGNELAIKWDSGEETFVSLLKLREECPCAVCKGEVDVMGHLHIGPASKLSAASATLRSFSYVGGYGIKPVWGDGHSSGIYSFDYIRRIV
ncbi:MAG: hypothetical protein JWN25_1988 [Verrucomicrobiales bacterium]|nr:hypothetical protein [Verrucomicrobiales bacterium]